MFETRVLAPSEWTIRCILGTCSIVYESPEDSKEVRPQKNPLWHLFYVLENLIEEGPRRDFRGEELWVSEDSRTKAG